MSQVDALTLAEHFKPGKQKLATVQSMHAPDTGIRHDAGGKPRLFLYLRHRYLICCRRHVTFLPFSERHADLHFALTDLAVDTHGVMKAWASTALLEGEIDTCGRVAGLGRRELHRHLRLNVSGNRL